MKTATQVSGYNTCVLWRSNHTAMRIAFLFLLITVGLSAFAQKELSSVETFHVKESNVFWKADVTDTLNLSVIHAEHIAIMNTSFPKEKNITKQVSFKLKNTDGEGRAVNGRIKGVADFNGQQLYTAELEIGITSEGNWEYRKVECILADLSDQPHRLIVGKNWLGTDFSVK